MEPNLICYREIGNRWEWAFQEAKARDTGGWAGKLSPLLLAGLATPICASLCDVVYVILHTLMLFTLLTTFPIAGFPPLSRSFLTTPILTCLPFI